VTGVGVTTVPPGGDASPSQDTQHKVTGVGVTTVRPRGDVSPLQGYLSIMLPVLIYPPEWRETIWSNVPCLRKSNVLSTIVHHCDPMPHLMSTLFIGVPPYCYYGYFLGLN